MPRGGGRRDARTRSSDACTRRSASAARRPLPAAAPCACSSSPSSALPSPAASAAAGCADPSPSCPSCHVAQLRSWSRCGDRMHGRTVCSCVDACVGAYMQHQPCHLRSSKGTERDGGSSRRAPARPCWRPRRPGPPRRPRAPPEEAAAAAPRASSQAAWGSGQRGLWRAFARVCRGQGLGRA